MQKKKYQFLTPVIPLGHVGNKSFFYFLRDSKNIVELSPASHGPKQLLAWARETQWKAFPGAKHCKKGLDWDALAEALMDQGRRAGHFDPSCVRGIGAWKEGSNVVFNSGDALYVDGQRLDLDEAIELFGHLYEAKAPVSIPSEKPLTSEEGARLLSLFKRWNWQAEDIAPNLILGWVACAPICGALDWRSHIWISGAAQTGKTTLLGVVLRLLGDLAFSFEGSTTEAAIRQTLRNDARPTILDEIEASQSNSRAIIELLRVSASDGCGRIARGTAEGIAQHFMIRTSALLAGIVSNLPREADQSRFVQLELKPHGDNLEDRRELYREIERLDNGLGSRLVARMIQAIRSSQFDLCLSIFHECILDAGGTHRDANVLGPLLAAAHVVTNDEAVEAEDAAQQAYAAMALRRENERDEVQCLNHVLAQVVRADDGTNPSIWELIASVRSTEGLGRDERELLKRHGLRVETDGLYVANSHPGTAKLFYRSSWAAGGHARVLQRLPGATTLANSVSFGSIKQRVTVIPWELVNPAEE